MTEREVQAVIKVMTTKVGCKTDIRPDGSDATCIFGHDEILPRMRNLTNKSLLLLSYADDAAAISIVCGLIFSGMVIGLEAAISLRKSEDEIGELERLYGLCTEPKSKRQRRKRS